MKDIKQSGRPRKEGATLRQQANRRPSGSCQKCSEWSECLHLDHIIPVGEGGENTLANLQWLCDDCNRVKTASDLSRMLTGRKHTHETREKMRESHLRRKSSERPVEKKPSERRPSPPRGPMSMETREKIRSTLQRPEVQEKMRKSRPSCQLRIAVSKQAADDMVADILGQLHAE